MLSPIYSHPGVHRLDVPAIQSPTLGHRQKILLLIIQKFYDITGRRDLLNICLVFARSCEGITVKLEI